MAVSARGALSWAPSWAPSWALPWALLVAAAALVASLPTATASALDGALAPSAQTIEQIQGTGASSPLVGRSVVTTGVVTASYPSGGLRGFTIQTPGTGGAVDLGTHRASDGLFVYLGSNTGYPAIGDHVSVEGTISEYHGLTELTATMGLTALTGPVARPRPVTRAWPAAAGERESLESMTMAPRGRYTVTDNYALNRYGEIGLAHGRTPLPQPTDVAPPGAAAAAVAARNAGRLVTLDDGASVDYLPPGGGVNQDVRLPYLGPQHPARVGAPVRFRHPVVVDYRNDAWKLQPTEQVTAANGPTTSPVGIPNTRTRHPAPVGGAVRIASFNVLNYFTETGADWVTSGGTCTYYTDRDGDPVTDHTCSGDGPRGAAEADDLQRQQAKIVAAITGLGADVLSLEEIENSAKYGPDRDSTLATLVRALNAAAGSNVWGYVPSPARRPAVADEDVIRTAFIYRRAAVRPVGVSRILVGSAAFDNAREPLAQKFRTRAGQHATPFLVVVNHFKSKGSGVDDGTGQGLSNPARVAQAGALARFATRTSRLLSTSRVFLVGDFNSYTHEDPMRRLYTAGYTDIGSRFTGESTYLFGGMVGSLDHVLANRPALRSVVGADVWNINSVESVAFEYSRTNANATPFYAPDQFRASDHDPLLVGIRRR